MYPGASDSRHYKPATSMQAGLLLHLLDLPLRHSDYHVTYPAQHSQRNCIDLPELNNLARSQEPAESWVCTTVLY